MSVYLLNHLFMFYAKVSSYARDRDGRVHRFDKSFANPDEYRSFLTENPEYSSERMWPFWGFFEWWNDLFSLESPSSRKSDLQTPALPDGIDISRYEQAAREIEAGEQKKARRKSELELGKQRIQSYLERFKNAGRSDLTASAEADLKKIDEELASLG